MSLWWLDGSKLRRKVKCPPAFERRRSRPQVSGASRYALRGTEPCSPCLERPPFAAQLDPLRLQSQDEGRSTRLLRAKMYNGECDPRQAGRQEADAGCVQGRAPVVLGLAVSSLTD